MRTALDSVTRTHPFRWSLLCGAGVAMLTLGLAGGLGGCSPHGKYTEEHISAAKVKMNMLKSATEYQMATQAFSAGDLEKALKHIDYTITLAPHVAKSHVLKGRTLMEMGDLEQSSLCFIEAARLDEENVDAAYYQGLLAERLTRKQEALAFYQKAESLEPANAQFTIAAAEMLIDLGRVEEAQQYLEARREQFVNNAGIKQVMGNVAMLNGDTKTAQLMFNDARLLDPENQAIVESLIRAQIANGDFADAEVHLSKLLKQRDTTHRRDLRHLRAKSLVQLDRPIEARDLYIELTKDSAGAADVEAWRGLGQVSFTLRDMQRVKLCASRLIAIAPKSPDGWVLRGLMNRRTGELAAAKMNFEQALRFKRDAETLILLGLVQQEMQNYEQARVNYLAALEKEPENNAVKQLLATVPTE